MRRILISDEAMQIEGYGFGLPWDNDSVCYNFDMPREITSSQDAEALAGSADTDVLIIGTPLRSYDFIGSMAGLRQLYIYRGSGLGDISFIRGLTALRQLYIAQSEIRSLEPLIELLDEKNRMISNEPDLWKRILMGLEAVCINSEHELDCTDLKEAGRYCTELIINGRDVRHGR